LERVGCRLEAATARQARTSIARCPVPGMVEAHAASWSDASGTGPPSCASGVPRGSTSRRARGSGCRGSAGGRGAGRSRTRRRSPGRGAGARARAARSRTPLRGLEAQAGSDRASSRSAGVASWTMADWKSGDAHRRPQPPAPRVASSASAASTPSSSTRQWPGQRSARVRASQPATRALHQRGPGLVSRAPATAARRRWGCSPAAARRRPRFRGLRARAAVADAGG
jgi:hypothetical protein